ncbi:MAG: ATP-binding protein [Verrucomicrobiota bacterium]
MREFAFLEPACEAALQELAHLAAQMAGMPFAAITLSEPNRIWFKAAYGFDAQRLPAGIALCQSVATQRTPLIVDDAITLPEFATSAGVLTYPHLRSFVGIPLQNGHVHPIGSLLVGDSEPRHLTAEQQNLLSVLARQVITHLELASKMYEIQQAENSCLLAEHRLRQQNTLLHLQQQIAAAANEAPSAVAAMQAGLDLVCAHTGWPVGHCYVLDHQPQSELISAGAWSFREPQRFAEFRQATEAAPFASGCGLSGAVLVSGRHLCINNLAAHDNFRRGRAAQACHLNCGYFFPMTYAGKTVGTMEFFSEQAQPTTCPLLTVLDYVGNQLGQVIGRERSHHALRESEHRFRDLFESSPDAIFVEDFNGNVLDVNATACRLHECNRDWLVGKNVLDLVPPAQRETVARDFPRLTRQELDYCEGESLTPSGQSIPVEIRASQIKFSGQPALLIHVRDITARKRLEQQFLQAQRVEAIGQLAGGVAHDFNNILTVITGYSELLLMRQELAEPIRRSIQEIAKAGFRGGSLTRQLLAFSRKQVLKPQVLDLNLVVTDIESILRRLIGEDIELITYPQPDLGHIKADPAQLEQVLLNLAVNARDAMPTGGSLVIGTADMDLDSNAARRLGDLAPGRYVVLSVTDSGCGMPPEVIRHIFEAFFTTKSVGKGTGLGLATCFGIVKQSGGHIVVESTVGHGTKFRIYLPRVTEAATPVTAHPVPDNAQLSGTETILLVEDEMTVRSLAAETLRQFGYTVLEAGNGEEALLLAQETQGKRINLLLTDVVMPQVSGRELAEVIQKTYPSIRVLFTSGYTNDNILIQEILRDSVGFLEKPYTGTLLVQKVREILGNSGGNPGDNHGQDPHRG